MKRRRTDTRLIDRAIRAVRAERVIAEAHAGGHLSDHDHAVLAAAVDREFDEITQQAQR